MKRLLIGFYVCSTAAFAADKSPDADQCLTGAAQRPLVYDATGKAVGSFGVGGPGSFAILQIDGAVVYASLKREGQGQYYPLDQREPVDSSALRWADTSPNLSALYPEPLSVRYPTSPGVSSTAGQRGGAK
jgi:hypothetical protein